VLTITNKITKRKRQESKRHRRIVNPVRWQTHLLWGYQARKEIH